MTRVDLADLIRDLHYIHTFEEDHDLTTFDHILSRAYSQLCELVQPSGAKKRLFLRSSIFPHITLGVYTQLPNAPLQNDKPTLSRIVDFVDNEADQELVFDFASQLKGIELQLSSRGLPAVNGSYNSQNSDAFIESELSEFLRSAVDPFLAAESSLIAYISRCLSYQIQNSTHGEVGDDENIDTERLMMADYQTNDHMRVEMDPLDFESSDNFLTKTFHVFVDLAMKSDTPQTYDEIYPYANVMVAFYKAESRVSAFQFFGELNKDIDSTISNHERALDFICGSSIRPGIVSASMRDHAKDTLTNPGGRKNISNESFKHEKPKPLSQNYTKTEFTSLVADFETVVATLAEFGSNSNLAVGSTFRHYIFLVCEVLPEVATTADFAFIDTVTHTVSQVAHYAAEDDSSQILLDEVLSDMQEISNVMSTVSLESTLLIRLAISETQTNISYIKSCLQKWNSKALAVSQLSVIYEEDWISKREKMSLETVFQKWSRKISSFDQLKSEASTYCEIKQMSHFFNKRWIQQVLKNLENEGLSDSFQRGKMLRIWMENAVKRWEMQSASKAYYAANCLKKTFRIWTLKRENLKALKFQANFAGRQLKAGSDSLLKLKIWEYWQSKIDVPVSHVDPHTLSLSEKLSQLDKLARRFLLKKYLGILVSRSENSKNLGLIQIFRSKNLKRHCFEIWRMKKKASNIREEITRSRDHSLKRSVFDGWFDQLQSRTSADLTWRRKTLKRALLLWKSKLAETKFSQVQSDISRRSVFKQWILRSRGASLVKDTDKQLASHMFSKWVQMTQKSLEIKQIALNTDRKFAISEAWAIWRSRMATNEEMTLVADLNIQRKYLNLIGTKQAKIRDSQGLAESRLTNSSFSFSERIQAQAALRRWQESYLFRYESEARHALTYFQESIRDRGMLSLMFKHWKSRLLHIRKRQESLEKNLVFFHNTNILKSECLMLWIDTTRANAQAMERSIEFHKALLHKKFLLVWYEKYVSKARYLMEIAEEVANKKEYNHMLELLRKWNLAYTKNVRRNQQTCEMFVEKWQRIHLKSLFELWSYKANRRVAVEHYAEANTTFNTSPLSRKFLGNGGSLQYLDGASYLYTPVKKQVSRPELTPYKSGGSPTRLQETNEKMKTSRMDAMTNRYKLARGEDSGKNGRNTVSEAYSLHPPTRKSEIPTLASVIRPPPPPRFDNYSDVLPAPEATSSPGESRHDHSSTEPEDLVLETAKRLQKIKPVVIPSSTKQDKSEFRVSPIKKLRERLQSRAEALRSPSEVFDN